MGWIWFLVLGSWFLVRRPTLELDRTAWIDSSPWEASAMPRSIISIYHVDNK
jgi:hypothetical protein